MLHLFHHIYLLSVEGLAFLVDDRYLSGHALHLQDHVLCLRFYVAGLLGSFGREKLLVVDLLVLRYGIILHLSDTILKFFIFLV